MYHVDSFSGSNFRVAQAVMIKIIEPTSDSSSVLELQTPQQCNHYDCGVYVIAAAEVLANATISSKKSLEKILNEEPML